TQLTRSHLREHLFHVNLFYIILIFFFFFFFSSRRRHTRCLSDWSSDVCSSDLDGNEMCQGVERAINVARACNFASFVLVWQKHIYALEHGLDVTGPKIIRVVVGVE